MKDHSGCKRQFTQLSTAWYGPELLKSKNEIDVVTIGYYHPSGGTTGEFQVLWEYIGRMLTPKLCAFDDSWSALYEYRDLLELMAGIDGKDVSPDEFCKILSDLGIEDATKLQY